MIAALHLAATLILTGILVWSGVAKLRDVPGTEVAVQGFSILPTSWAPVVARALPLVELAVAGALLSARHRGFEVAAWGSVLLMGAFSLLVAVSLARGVTPPCNCFGEDSSEPISARTLVRNIGLLALAVVVALGGAGYRGVVPTLVTSTGEQVVLALTLSVAVGAVVWLLVRDKRFRTQVQALRSELEDWRERGARPTARDIPQARLASLGGDEVTLADLVAERAQLLVAVSPTCGACKDLIPVIPQWQHALAKELDVKILSTGRAEDIAQAYGEGGVEVLADVYGEAFTSLRIGGTPGAVLLGTNGKVAAGPALGAESILELVTAIIQAIGVNMMTGRAHQAQGGRPLGGDDTGESYLPPEGHEIADFDVVLEDGSGSSFQEAMASFNSGDQGLPVVAWRNGCMYCNEIATAMKPYSERGEVVLLINEPISTVREQGLVGPVMSTVDIDASAALGVPGTPGGYPVREGRLVPGGGVGGGSVLRMLRDRAAQLGTEPEAAAPSAAAGDLDPGHAHQHQHEHHHISTEVTPIEGPGHS